MMLEPGRKLGPYEIGSPLGAGGMGEVYRARDTRLDRTVAIKILPPHLSENSLAKERFDREARAISSLNHPNICHLYDVGLQDGINYLVMEYLEGETLADRLRKGALPLGQTLRYGRDICDGLETAHRSGVIHRDLKRGNIMLTKTGAKLMDFGLAKPLTPIHPPSSQLTRTLSTPDRPLTAEGTIVGTFQYSSNLKGSTKQFEWLQAAATRVPSLSIISTNPATIRFVCPRMLRGMALGSIQNWGWVSRDVQFPHQLGFEPD